MESPYLVPGWSWHVKDGRLGWGMQSMRGADVATFQALSCFWGRDANRIYVAGSEMRDADPATFQVLNPLYAKDARAVYTLKGPIKEADPATFEAIGPWEHFFNTTNGYAKDCNHVYHTILGGKACIVKGADATSFTACGNGYGQDNSSVFFERTKLAGAAPRDWKHLCGPHSRASKNAYVLGRFIRGADGRRLESLPILNTADYWARDDEAYYHWDKPNDRDQYLSAFHDAFVFLGKAASISLSWNQRSVELSAEDPNSWSIADFAWLTITCKEWLQKPNLQVEQLPDIGEMYKHGAALHFKLHFPPTWMNEDRIWIFRTVQDVVPTARKPRLLSTQVWWGYSSRDHASLIQSLIEAAR